MERIETRGRPRSEEHNAVSEELLSMIEESIGKPVIQVRTDRFKSRCREGAKKVFTAYRVSVACSELREALSDHGYRISLFFMADCSVVLRAVKE